VECYNITSIAQPKKASYLEAPEDFGIDVSTRLAEMRAEEKAPAQGGR
jgi:hypothetical protein